MSLSLHRPSRCALCVGALALAVVSSMAMNQALLACADDERDAVANAAAEAEATANALQSQLEGIDVSLAQVFIDLQTFNGQIPATQAVYESATVTYGQKTREYATAMGELSAAQGEQSRVGQSLNQVTTQTDDAQHAIADLVHRKYREDNVDPVVVALTAGGMESIVDHVAAADTALRTESQTMTAALDVSSFQRTQATRQDAITERTIDLEIKTAQVEEEAKQAKNETDAKLTELSSLKGQAQTKQAEWGAQRGQVGTSLSQAEADYQACSVELAAINATNRASGASYVSAPNLCNSFDISIVVTPPLGMRYHPVPGVTKGHSDIDMVADCGTVIRAVASGYANAASSDASAGNYVDISHGLVGGNSVIIEHLHMQAQYVFPGQYANAGDALGEVGSTGYATGCHLHFGVLQNGSYVEPMDYL